MDSPRFSRNCACHAWFHWFWSGCCHQDPKQRTRNRSRRISNKTDYDIVIGLKRQCHQRQQSKTQQGTAQRTNRMVLGAKWRNWIQTAWELLKAEIVYVVLQEGETIQEYPRVNAPSISEQTKLARLSRQSHGHGLEELVFVRGNEVGILHPLSDPINLLEISDVHVPRVRRMSSI